MKFTLLTVTWNNLAGLKATHGSVRVQTMRDWEWLVIDGASTDGSVEFLRSLDLPELRLVSEPDGGIYDAMNKGIGLARGDYVLFLNAGDELHDAGTLEAVARAMQPAADIVYGDCVLSMEDGTSLHRRAGRSSLDYGMWSYHQAIFYRREAIGDVRYDPAYPVCADYAFTASMVRRGATVQAVDLPVCRYECGGFSDRNRGRLVREHRAIRRDILHVPQPRRAVLDLAHAASNLARAWLPALHRALRFGRAGRQV